MSIEVRDWSGRMTKAPKDYARVVAEYQDKLIVWSKSGKNLHQVRYGLQVKTFRDAVAAAHEFGECVLHLAACEGRE